MSSLPPGQWNLTDPPTHGTLAEADVSHAAVCQGDVYTVTLVHMPTSTRATTRAATREHAMHAAWVALHAMLTEDTDERMIDS